VEECGHRKRTPDLVADSERGAAALESARTLATPMSLSDVPSRGYESVNVLRLAPGLSRGRDPGSGSGRLSGSMESESIMSTAGAAQVRLRLVFVGDESND
jgi:hypothetical protein